VDTAHAGVASGVNNAIARAAGLLSLAVVPAAVGLTGAAYRDPVTFGHGFRLAMYSAAGLMAVGAVLSWVTVSSRPCAAPPGRVACPVSSPQLQPHHRPDPEPEPT
jgi:hypothetical protein